MKDSDFDVRYHTFKYQPTADFALELKELCKPLKTYICWKLVGLDFVAIERSLGFNVLVSIFVQLGQRGI